VTLNDTGAAVDYGAGATSTVNPALSISAGGIVLAGQTAATTYVQKISGNVVVYNGGILRLATTGSRMPTNSSFTWTVDCVSNVDFGIIIRAGGEFTAGGEDKTRWTLLTADEAVASTSIQVVSTAGWKVGDTLVFSSTSTTNAQHETKVIQSVDSATQVTLTAGLTFAHTGTAGNVIGEVGNLTSNVTIIGTSSTVGTYILCKSGSNVNLDNMALQHYGSNTVDKRGLQTDHITGSANSMYVNKCVAYIGSVLGCLVGCTAGASNHYHFTDNVIYNIPNSSSSVGLYCLSGGTGNTYDFSAVML